MSLSRNVIAAAALGLVAVSAAPASAQDRYERPRSRATEEIARGARDAAEAIVTVRDALRGAVDTVRYSGPERYAVEACSYRAERYGRVSIDRVEPYKRRSWRVYGIAEPSDYGSRYRYDRRYEPRSFSCTVREDGKVTKFKTKKIRYRRY
jgi:hypothetical protein